jgi:hypothetical protein
MTPRLHVSSSKLARVRDKYSYKQQPIDVKPDGFWWSVGTARLEWCEAEEFRVSGLVYALDVDETRMLQLGTCHELDAFTAKYSCTLYGVSLSAIDWGAVALDYDGIEIVPYLWQRRHHKATGWYYGWDCACGVTWKPSAVIRAMTFAGKWEYGNIPQLCAAGATTDKP